MNSNERYSGKPLLRLLECYVLWAINQLPPQDARNLDKITPKLSSIYQVQGTWQQIIAVTLQLPDSAETTIRSSWEQYKNLSLREKFTLSAQQFAETFVDQNLVK